MQAKEAHMNRLAGFSILTTIAVLSCATAIAQRRDRDAEEAAKLENERQAILSMAEATLGELRENPDASALLDQAYGTAVFDSTKAGLIVTGAGGTGVAQRKDGADPVFMHMGSGGIGLGAGVDNYKLVMLFENEETYDKFVEGGWSVGGTAQAAAGRDGTAAVATFRNGVAVYHLSDKGLIAQADASGVKFWQSKELNDEEGRHAEAADRHLR